MSFSDSCRKSLTAPGSQLPTPLWTNSSTLTDSQCRWNRPVALERGAAKKSGRSAARNAAIRQLNLLDSVWPGGERFPHNGPGSTVQAVLYPDLHTARRPLIVTGYASLVRVVAFLSHCYSRQRELELVRLLLGHEPWSGETGSTNRSVTQLDAEVREFWVRRGISLYQSADVLNAIEFLQHGPINVRRSGQSLGPVHAKIYRGDASIMIGSSNLSSAGMTWQVEGNSRYVPEEGLRYDEACQLGERVWETGADFRDRLLDLLNELLHRSTWQEALARACAEVLEGPWADRFVVNATLGDAKPLWPSQRQGLAQAMWVLEHVGSVLVADATGSGKTRMGGYLIAATVRQLIWGSGRTRRDMMPVLLCPPPVQANWDAAATECGQALEVYSDGALSNGGPELLEAATAALRRAQVLGVDEAHRFVNRGAERTRLLFNNMADYVLLFTAAPISRGSQDLLSLVDLLGADNFDDDVLDILGRLLSWRRDSTEALAASEIHTLRRAIQRFTVRRTKATFMDCCGPSTSARV